MRCSQLVFAREPLGTLQPFWDSKYQYCWLKIVDCWLSRLWAAAHPLGGALHIWVNLQDWDWPLHCGCLCISNFITPTYFRVNPRGILTLTHHCMPVYIGTSCIHFEYIAGTSGSIKDFYATFRCLNPVEKRKCPRVANFSIRNNYIS